jgi:hypothetical protein
MRHGGPVINKFSPTTMTGRGAAPTPAPCTTAATAPPVFAGSSSNAPTMEYRGHHDVMPPQVDESVFRQAWLVRSRVLNFYETGLIDRQQYEAVLGWRRAAERLGRLPTQKWLARIDGSRQPGNGVTEAMLAAASALRASALALGPRRVGLLLAAVIQERSWSDLGRQLGVSNKTAKTRVLEAIGALALWQAGKPVPPPPSERFRNQPSSW